MSQLAMQQLRGLHAAFIYRFGADAMASLQHVASHRAAAPALRIIALGGDQLTGKSTLTAALSSALGGADTVSAGSTMRALAHARGLTVAQLSVELSSGGAEEGAVDVELDFRTLRQLVGAAGATSPPQPVQPLILEGRMPAVLATYASAMLGHTLPVFRCYLRCAPHEVALRIAERELGAGARIEMERRLMLWQFGPPPVEG